MINIAICDDDSKDLGCAQNMLTAYMQKHSHCEIKIHSFSNPLELLSYIENQGGFDILFLDIFMSGVLGTNVT